MAEHRRVGGIVRAGEDHAEGTATLQCLSLDAILRNRYLQAAASTYAGSVGSAFTRILDDANGANASTMDASAWTTPPTVRARFVSSGPANVASCWKNDAQNGAASA